MCKFDAVLAAYEAEVAALRCLECSPKQVCNGWEEDHGVVSRRGHCIDRLKELFSLAREATLGYYDYYSLLLSEVPDADVAFWTLNSEDKPHGFDIEVQVGGRFKPGRGEPDRIYLVFQVEELDRQTARATLYVLLHEWMVHAFQGVTKGEADESEDYDAFAEGWMDWVAARVLGEITTGVGPCGSLAGRCRHPNAFRDLGTDFHRARRKRRGTPYGSWIAYGVEAAEKILGQMERLCGPDGWHRFLRLSFDLNLIPLSTAQRCMMVQKLYDHTPPRGGLHRPDQFETVPRILRRYLDDPSQVERFAREILAL